MVWWVFTPRFSSRQFAGRNWNHGQTVELVLRRPDGRFYPLPYIMSVMCHEVRSVGTTDSRWRISLFVLTSQLLTAAYESWKGLPGGEPGCGVD